MSVGGVSGLIAIYDSLLQTNAAQTALGGPAQAASLTGQGATAAPGQSATSASPNPPHAGHPPAANAGASRLNTVA